MADTHISIALGIFIGLLASFVQSLGLTIQRKSHVLNQRLPEDGQRLEYRRPLWLLGFGIFISSNILGSLVQIASLPVVILAPLGAVSLLWNALFARLLLGDIFSAWMILGTLFIAGGAVLIALFGIVPEVTRSLEDLLELFRRPTFVVYFSLLGAVVLVSLTVTHIAEFRLSRIVDSKFAPRSTGPTPPITLEVPINPSTLTTGMTDTVTDAITNERTPLLDSKSRSSTRSPSLSSIMREDPSLRSMDRTRLFLAISYASFSGIISGMCLLFAKSGVELLLLTFQGQNQFWRWEAWVLVLALVIFALLQLWYLHKGLVLADPTLVCPSAFCFYNLSSIVNGLVYFDQFSLISSFHLVLVGLGIVVLLVGVWIVSIQAGGGADVAGSWKEEEALSDEGEGQLVDECAQDVPAIGLERSLAPAEETNSTPVAVEWGTRSEPHITISTSQEALHELRSPADLPLSPRSTASQPPFQTHGSVSTHLPSRTRASASHRRRPTIDSYSYIQQHHRSSTRSYYTPYNTHVNTHLSKSPPLPTVSALAGAGFQIGLSPVSPGFAIVPLERRSISSGLGIPGGSGPRVSFIDREREGERRRTVSESDARKQAFAAQTQGDGTRRSGLGYSGLHDGDRDDRDTGSSDGSGREESDGRVTREGRDGRDVSGRRKGKDRLGSGRSGGVWDWWRRAFSSPRS